MSRLEQAISCCATLASLCSSKLTTPSENTLLLSDTLALGWEGTGGRGGGGGGGGGTLTRTAPGRTPGRPSSVRPCAGDIAETWWDTRWRYTFPKGGGTGPAWDTVSGQSEQRQGGGGRRVTRRNVRLGRSLTESTGKSKSSEVCS